MGKLKIIIEKTADYYDAYAENCEGVYGAGETVETAKENVLRGLELFVKTSNELPEILKGKYEIEYSLDVQSFLNHYSKLFTKAALERMTGINQKQIGHYATGLRNPRLAQLKKIDDAMHFLSTELSQVHLHASV